MFGQVEKTVDDDLLRRVDGLRSGLAQARHHIASRAADKALAEQALGEIEDWLTRAADTTAATPMDERKRLVTKADAELCLYEPSELLKVDRVRIEDRFFRLSEGARSAWTAALKGFDDNQDNGPGYRQLLRSLTYEVAQAGANFERLTGARRQTLLFITAWSAIIFVIIGGLFLDAFSASLAAISAAGATAPTADPLDVILRSSSLTESTPGIKPTLALLLAGMLGAMVFVFQSVLVEEKLRPENKWPLLLNILVRVGFGALYALVAVIAVLTGLLPLSVPSGGPKAFMILTLVAVAAGLSDKLFGEVIGGIIEGKKAAKASPSKDKA